MEKSIFIPWSRYLGGIGDKAVGDLPYAEAGCGQLCSNFTGYLSGFGGLILGMIFQLAFNVSFLQIKLSYIPKVEIQNQLWVSKIWPPTLISCAFCCRYYWWLFLREKHEFEPLCFLTFNCLSWPALAFELNYTMTTKRFCLFRYSYIIAAIPTSTCGVQKQTFEWCLTEKST